MILSFACWTVLGPLFWHYLLGCFTLEFYKTRVVPCFCPCCCIEHSVSINKLRKCMPLNRHFLPPQSCSLNQFVGSIQLRICIRSIVALHLALKSHHWYLPKLIQSSSNYWKKCCRAQLNLLGIISPKGLSNPIMGAKCKLKAIQVHPTPVLWWFNSLFADLSGAICGGILATKPESGVCP